MDNKKFEQLIDLIINENEEQARALFHDIVVEKSREIYESMMDENDQVGDLMGEIESEEEGMSDDDEFSGDLEPIDGDESEFDPEAEFASSDEVDADEFEPSEEVGEEDLEDRVVDLEDKLDELMAEFEALMADEGGEDADAEADLGSEEDADAEEDLGSEEDLEGEELQEAIQMKKVSVTHGDNGVQTKSPVAANSGKAGMASKPVAASSSTETGRSAPAVKPLGQSFKNAPGAAGGKTESAPKPTTAQASGVNTKSPVSESRKLATRKPVAKAKK